MTAPDWDQDPLPLGDIDGTASVDMTPRDIRVPDRIEGATIQERFEAFHELNPWVLAWMERLTREWLASGKRRLGIKMLTEILRWEHGRQTSGDTFKISNDYTSRYARLMIARNPEWADVFVLRELTAA